MHRPGGRRAAGKAPHEGEGRDGKREEERGPEPGRHERQDEPARDEDQGRREVSHGAGPSPRLVRAGSAGAAAPSSYQVSARLRKSPSPLAKSTIATQVPSPYQA